MPSEDIAKSDLRSVRPPPKCTVRTVEPAALRTQIVLEKVWLHHKPHVLMHTRTGCHSKIA